MTVARGYTAGCGTTSAVAVFHGNPGAIATTEEFTKSVTARSVDTT